MIPRPLSGKRVLDLSQYIAGSTCGQVLADFGADVVKVEPPSGDPSRALGASPQGSPFFRQYNTGKSSVRMDLSAQADRARLDEMLHDADAVIMNYSAATRRKLGLEHTTLRASHPRLVVVLITGYGVDDPRTAFDSITQAASGFGYVNADEHGKPRISAGYPTDVYTGLFAAMSAAMALVDDTDEGTVIDVPMLEVAMSALCGTAMLSAADGETVPPGSGNRDAATAPSTTFACSDGHAYVYAGLDKHWERLRVVVGGPAGTRGERLADPAPYEEVVGAWTAARTVDEVCREMAELGIAAGPVSRPAAALAELHRHRPGAVTTIVDGTAVPQFPAYFDGARIPRSPAPVLIQEAHS